MRRPPPISAAAEFPVVTAVAVLCLLATIAWWTGFAGDAFLEIRVWNEPWRLFTSALVHANLMHIAFNLMWHWEFGTLIEPRLGSFRTLLFFALCAAGSGAAEYAFLDGGVGLSGVTYGEFGFLWVASRRDRRLAGALDRDVTRLFVIWFFACIVLSWLGILPVANFAHGFGALFGALAGWVMTAPGATRALAGSVTAALLAVVIGGTGPLRPYVSFSERAGYEECDEAYWLMKEERWSDAEALLERSVALSPDAALCWYNLGVARVRQGDLDGARDAWTRAQALDPSDPMTRDALRLVGGGER